MDTFVLIVLGIGTVAVLLLFAFVRGLLAAHKAIDQDREGNDGWD